MSTGMGGPQSPAGDAGADGYAACLAGMRAALATVGTAPAWQLGEDVLLERFDEVLAVRAGVEELTARLVAQVGAREVPRVQGATSLVAWLTGTRGLSGSDAARLVAESRVHAGAPSQDTLVTGREARVEPTRAAWAAGVLSAERAVVAAEAVDRVSGEVSDRRVAAMQTDLVELSPSLTYRDFQQACRHATAVVDPDSVDRALAQQLEAEEQRAVEQTRLSFRRVGDGTTRFSGRLPDLQAQLWKNLLDTLTAPRHTATQQTGQPGQTQPVGTEPPMRYPQRLGQALVELLEHFPTDTLPRHGVNNATLVVTMDLEQLRTGLGQAVLDTGGVVSPGQVRRLACNAGLIPAIFDGTSTPLDLGRTRRLFTPAQRIALAIRDGGCVWPGCDRPPAWCEAHHVTTWARGGPSDLPNACLLCPWHHRLAHHSDWQLRMSTDGVPEIIPPTRIDPHQHPRRHTRLRC